MAKRARKKREARERPDPRQLGLFDALDSPNPQPAPSPAKRNRRSRAAPTTSGGAPASPQRQAVLDPRETARYLGVSVSTLKLWRAKKIGPRWTIRGARLIGYRPADLEQFLELNSAKR